MQLFCQFFWHNFPEGIVRSTENVLRHTKCRQELMGGPDAYPWCQDKAQPGDEFFIIMVGCSVVQSSLSIINGTLPRRLSRQVPPSNIKGDYAKLAATEMSAGFPRSGHVCCPDRKFCMGKKLLASVS